MMKKTGYCWNCVISAVLSAVGIYSLVLGASIIWSAKQWIMLDAFLVLVLGMLFVSWGKDLKKNCCKI